jgi:hypothetical protein
MYFILDEKDLAGKQILLVDFHEYGEEPTIVTTDHGIHIQAANSYYDNVEFSHVSEDRAEEIVFEDPVLVEKLTELNVIQSSDVTRYRLKAEAKEVERRKQREAELERREMEQYMKLKRKFESK